MFSGLTPQIPGTSQSLLPYAGSYQRPSPPSDEELTTLVLDHIRKANNTLNFRVLPHFANIKRLIPSLMPAVVEEMKKKTELQILCLEGLGLTASAITPLIGFLETNPPVHTLNLDGNSLRDEGAAQIGELLSQNTVLENLSLIQCGIWTEGFLKIAEALKSNTTLTGLIYHNEPRMEPAAGTALTEIVALNTTLTTLECSLSLQEPERLIEALLENSTLTAFKLPQYQIISEEGFQNLAEVIRTTTTLHQLTFNLQNMSAERFTRIAAALTCNSSLQSLELRQFQFSNLPAQGVIDILTNNRILVELDLSSRARDGAREYTLPEQTQILELYRTHPSLIKFNLEDEFFGRNVISKKLDFSRLKQHNQEKRETTLIGMLLQKYLPIIIDGSYIQFAPPKVTRPY